MENELEARVQRKINALKDHVTVITKMVGPQGPPGQPGPPGEPYPVGTILLTYYDQNPADVGISGVWEEY